MPAGPITGHSIDALSFKLWTQFGDRVISPARYRHSYCNRRCSVTAGALELAADLHSRARDTGVAAAGDYRSEVPRVIADNYAWVDPALPPVEGHPSVDRGFRGHVSSRHAGVTARGS